MKKEAPEADITKRLEEMATSMEIDIDRNIALDDLLAVVKHEYIRANCPPCGRNSLILRFRDPVTEVIKLRGVLGVREFEHGGGTLIKDPTPEPA